MYEYTETLSRIFDISFLWNSTIYFESLQIIHCKDAEILK